MAMVEGMDVLACALGDRLGYYRALDGATLGPEELAERTGSSPRYAREWLEQQAMSGTVVRVDGGYALAPGAAEVLARPGTSLWMAPFLRQFAAAAAQWTGVADGRPDRSGARLVGVRRRHVRVPVGRERRPGAGAAWRTPGCRLRSRACTGGSDAGEPLRVADVGCGGAWASIALARRFPAVTVDAYDIDPPTVALARANVDGPGSPTG